MGAGAGRRRARAGADVPRFTADDIRSILAAGAGVADVSDEGAPLEVGIASVAVRELAAYAIEQWT